jgi:hypothetical protein
LCKAEDDSKLFLDYIRQFNYCAIYTLTDSEVKMDGEATVALRVKDHFWGDSKIYHPDWNLKISSMTPQYRNAKLLVLAGNKNDGNNDKNTGRSYKIYSIQSESFRVTGLKALEGKSIKWDLLFSRLKEEKSRIESKGPGTANNK